MAKLIGGSLRRPPKELLPASLTREPHPVSILVLLHAKQLLEVVLEGEVERLGREVSDHVGGVSAPQRAHALVLDDASETVADALVGLRETTLLDHLVLVLDEQLDALDGGCAHRRDPTSGWWEHQHQVLLPIRSEEQKGGSAMKTIGYY